MKAIFGDRPRAGASTLIDLEAELRVYWREERQLEPGDPAYVTLERIFGGEPGFDDIHEVRDSVEV